MNNKKTILHSLFHALAVIAYILIVVFIMNSMTTLFADQSDNFWTPVLVLMLFVVSAAITGSIVLGKPILLYLDGQKKEGILFLGYTIGWLFIFMLLAFVIYVLAA